MRICVTAMLLICLPACQSATRRSREIGIANFKKFPNNFWSGGEYTREVHGGRTRRRGGTGERRGDQGEDGETRDRRVKQGEPGINRLNQGVYVAKRSQGCGMNRGPWGRVAWSLQEEREPRCPWRDEDRYKS